MTRSGLTRLRVRISALPAASGQGELRDSEWSQGCPRDARGPFAFDRLLSIVFCRSRLMTPNALFGIGSSRF